MKHLFTDWSDSARPPWGAFALIVLAFGGLLWLVMWSEETYSGWQELAERYPAGERPLVNSLGTTNVVLKRADGTSWLLGSDRSGRRRFIEVGHDGDGFWMKSTRSTPSPALYIPWSQVAYCYLLSARLRDNDFEVSVHDQTWVDACKRATGPGGGGP
jgi:hypothetical protein